MKTVFGKTVTNSPLILLDPFSLRDINHISKKSKKLIQKPTNGTIDDVFLCD